MNLSGTLIRETRRSIGLSQTDLAVAGGLSLATIQNIEAGRANPSISTLRSAIEPLGLKVTVEPAESDWDALIALGLPLAGSGRPSRGDPAALRRHIQCAALEVDRELPMPDRARKRECLVALLLAISRHYPTRFRSWFRRSPLIGKLMHGEPSGRTIKLSRLALDRISEYL